MGLRQYSKDDRGAWLPYAVFAINNATFTLCGDLTLFFIDRGQLPRLPLSLPDLPAAGESPVAYAARMKALEQEVRALLHAANQERKAALDRGMVDTRFQVGDQVMLRTKELLHAAEVGKLRPRWEHWEGPFPVAAVAGPNTYTRRPSLRSSSAIRRSTSTCPSLTSFGRASRAPPLVRSPTRGSTWWSSSSTARRSAAGSTTWCCSRATPRWLTRGRRPSTSQTARSGSLSTRLQHPAALRPSGLTSVPVRRLLRKRPPRPLRRPHCCGPAPRTPARMGCGGRGPAGPPLRPPVLVTGRGLAARAHPAVLPAGPVHPRRRLPDADRQVRERDQHAPPSRSDRQRLLLGLADPGRSLRLSRRRNGTTISVLSRADPAGRIGCKLPLRKTDINGKRGK